ncbi:MAG: hypothetical protein LBT55_02795 [Clostridiaceae bacterium]|jgi:ribosomal protein L7Ae-like RNA K-turn-binding protein|nr:hypothetical protein [Clostridiaceae bacterium]
MSTEEQIRKIKAYLGFAVKSRSIVWGADNILARKRFYPLILEDETFDGKAAREIADYAGERIPLLKVSGLNALLNKEVCKVVAITDKNLAEIIKITINAGSD